jgi:hypothetical protein
MDKRFLSSQDVVKASRDFVCVRMLTYESAEEAKLLTSLFTGRSGELENTTFAILAPDGKTALVRAGRSPDMTFKDASEMASSMAKIALKYAEKEESVRGLPYVVDLRRAINTASCDIQPLVIVVAREKETREKIEAILAPLAWDKEFIGKFAYVTVSDTEALKAVDGAEKKDGVLLVQPDAYGMKAKVLASDAGTAADALAKMLKAGAAKFIGEAKESKKHIDAGVKQGVNWKTEIPVTDPGPPDKKP